MELRLRRLPKFTYWGIVLVVFIAGSVIAYTSGSDSFITTIFARGLLVLLAIGAIIRVTKPVSITLKLFLILFLFVVIFSLLAKV